jgi:hypothetical protein
VQTDLVIHFQPQNVEEANQEFQQPLVLQAKLQPEPIETQLNVKSIPFVRITPSEYQSVLLPKRLGATKIREYA